MDIGGGGGAAPKRTSRFKSFIQAVKASETTNMFRRVSNAALASPASVLSSKKFGKIYSGWGAVPRNRSKALGPSFYSAAVRVDAALAKSEFLQVYPPARIKCFKNIKNTKVASAEVAFDIVRMLMRTSG